MTDTSQSRGFGLYIHWPFCQAKCPYCDFNSHVSASIDQSEWRDAYLAELDRYAAETPDRMVRSVFFGGGTPSLMEPQTVDAILDRVSRNWRLENDVEITLEANPSSVEADRFTGYRTAGVNRVSLGVQSLNDDDLKRLGRLHSATEARKAIDLAQSVFDRSSFDLIYGRQDQTLDDWKAELTTALGLGSSHLSLYQLTIEAGTAFGDRHARGRLTGLPDEDLSADMYNLTWEMCDAAGLPPYEVSNYAAPGEASRHNLIYWQHGEYVGIGPGAHGRVRDTANRRWATSTELAPTKWLASVRSGSGEAGRECLTHSDQAAEFLMMGLRLREGISLNDYNGLFDEPLAQENLDHLKSIGAIAIENEHLIVQKQYVSVLNSVIGELLRD